MYLQTEHNRLHWPGILASIIFLLGSVICYMVIYIHAHRKTETYQDLRTGDKNLTVRRKDLIIVMATLTLLTIALLISTAITAYRKYAYKPPLT